MRVYLKSVHLHFGKIRCQKKVSPAIVEVPQHGSSILQLEVHHGVPGQDQVELGYSVHHRVMYLRGEIYIRKETTS